MKSKNGLLKKMTSMRFAIAIILALALFCGLGSFITQGQSYDWYAARYSERTAETIMKLGLDDVFRSPAFLLVSAFLCADLLLCNILRVGQLLTHCRAEKDPQKAFAARPQVSVSGINDPQAVFRRLGAPSPSGLKDGEGRSALFASKNAAGLWGAWVCHVGILLLIAGFALGQFTKTEYTVFGVPGQTKAIDGSGYELTIDDFRVDLSESGSVRQYSSDITVRPAAGAVPDSADGDPGISGEVGAAAARGGVSATVSVNHPAKLYGMKFYQNSTGWAAKLSVERSGEVIQENWLCAGEFVPVKDRPELVVLFNAFYPDYGAAVRGDTGGSVIKDPAYLYTVYYNAQILGMNVLTGDEVITIDDYTVSFTQPQAYTLIQVKKDSFTGLAFAGGVITLLGLVLAFYVQPVRLWAFEEDGSWTVCGSSPRGGRIFEERFTEAAGKEKNDAQS